MRKKKLLGLHLFHAKIKNMGRYIGECPLAWSKLDDHYTVQVGQLHMGSASV